MSEDQMFWIMSLWYHWVFPVIAVIVFLCAVMALYTRLAHRGRDNERDQHE